MNLKLKSFNSLLCFIILIFSGYIFSAEGYCYSYDNIFFNNNLNGEINNDENISNNILNKTFYFNNHGRYDGNCLCGSGGKHKKRSILYTATSNYPVININGEKFIKVNEYIAFSVSIKIANNGYVKAPFTDIDNRNKSSCNRGIVFTSGSEGYIKVLILKPIINDINYSGTLVSLYGRKQDGRYNFNNPLVKINFNINLKSRYYCSFGTGNIFTVDFGQINKSSFKNNKISNISKDLDINIKCNTPYQYVNFGVLAQAAKYDTVKTSNPTIGMLFSDKLTNLTLSPLKQNTSKAFISHGGTGHISLKLTPIQIEKVIKPGQFNGTAIIQLSLD